MPYYTVNVIVKVYAESEHEAYHFVKHGLSCAKKQELEYVDAEVMETEPDDDNIKTGESHARTLRQHRVSDGSSRT